MLKTLQPVVLLGLTLIVLPATAAEPLMVVLDRFVNPGHAPLVAAAEKGFFAAQGLEVTLAVPDQADPARLVANDKAQIVVISQPHLQMLVNQGLPLKRIGTLIATPLDALVVMASGPIESPADLGGRRVGYSADFERTLLGVMLAQHKLDLKDVTLIGLKHPLLPALLGGEVDAVIGDLRSFALVQMALAGKPGRMFYPEEEGIPAYEALILAAHRQKLDDARLAQFLQAVEQATHYLVNHPQAGWELVVARYPELDNEINRRAWSNLLTRFALRPAALDNGRYKRFAQFLAKHKAITAALPVSNYAVELGVAAAGL